MTLRSMIRRALTRMLRIPRISPETLGEAVPATRMGDDTSHPDTSSTTGGLGHDWLTMEVRFIPYDHLVGYDEVLSFDPINLDVD
jgi:hypothetical protein